MLVGVLTAQLHLPGVSSLKEKRHIIKSVIGRLQSRFNVSISEVEQQDSHTSAVLGMAVVSNERAFVDQQLDAILTFMRNDGRFYLGQVEARGVLVDAGFGCQSVLLLGVFLSDSCGAGATCCSHGSRHRVLLFTKRSSSQGIPSETPISRRVNPHACVPVAGGCVRRPLPSVACASLRSPAKMARQMWQRRGVWRRERAALMFRKYLK